MKEKDQRTTTGEVFTVPRMIKINTVAEEAAVKKTVDEAAYRTGGRHPNMFRQHASPVKVVDEAAHNT
jgi:hypothetical protein